jgi:hypothetical protein
VIDGANCSDEIFQHRCSQDSRKNCVVHCDEAAKRALLCYQQNDCGYRADSTLSLPRQVNGLYPTFLTKKWNQPSQTVACPDSYDGSSPSTKCLGDDLFELLKANPSTEDSKGDVVKQALDGTNSARGFERPTLDFRASDMGYYCLPQDAQGWRYTIFPAAIDTEKRKQCTAADCMNIALSSSDVTSVLYDDASKACMVEICEGSGCEHLKCVDGCPSKTEMQSFPGSCGEDFQKAIDTCNSKSSGPFNPCIGCPDGGVQLKSSLLSCCPHCLNERSPAATLASGRL